MLIKWLSGTQNLRTRPSTLEKEYGEANTTPCCQTCTNGQNPHPALPRCPNRSAHQQVLSRLQGAPFLRQKYNVLRFAGFFCALFSPTALFDWLFPTNLLYGVDALTHCLCPPAPCHQVTIRFHPDVRLIPRQRDVTNVFADVFPCALVHTCQSVCSLLL